MYLFLFSKIWYIIAINVTLIIGKELFTIEIIELSPNVTLRCFRDTRFKQGCLSFQLVGQMTAEDAAWRALLPSVLLRGTRKCPDLRSITQRLDTLYGASVSPLVRRVGDCQTTGLYCSLMDDRFALPGDRVLEPMTEFLGELLLDSPVEQEGFLPAFVESEKSNLISTIECELNDKRLYAQNRLLEKMCAPDSFGLPRLGRPEQIRTIDPIALRRNYLEALQTNPVQIFYVGSASQEEVARLLAPVVRGLSQKSVPVPPQSGLKTEEPGELTEEMDVTQGKLCMGFTTPATNRTEEFAAMQVLNVLFGGGMTSKLFQNVREKLSLCYSIGSVYYSVKGVVTVSAGIDVDRKDCVREEILHQLDACRQGHISEPELTAAREALCSSLRATHDSPGSIEGYYATAALSGLEMTPEQYIRAVEAVKKEQVVRCARQLELHTTYFLRGESR